MDSNARSRHPAVLVMRAILAVNFVRFALAWSPWFEGTADGPGEIDALFGGVTLGGYRPDFAWLVVTSVVALLAVFYFLLESREEPGAGWDATLCVGWLAAFLIYLGKTVHGGLLGFG